MRYEGTQWSCGGCEKSGGLSDWRENAEIQEANQSMAQGK